MIRVIVFNKDNKAVGDFQSDDLADCTMMKNLYRAAFPDDYTVNLYDPELIK